MSHCVISKLFLYCKTKSCSCKNPFLTCSAPWFCDYTWPWCFCLRAPSVRLSACSPWPPGSAADTPPSSPSPACAPWWPLPAGPAEGQRGCGEETNIFKKHEYLAAFYSDFVFCKIKIKRRCERCVCVCVCFLVPVLPSVGAPPVFLSEHCPCLKPREFSPPTPSGSHC